MKMLIAALLIATPAVACDRGCIDYQGLCACDQVPEKAVYLKSDSTEEPSHHPQPAWQRGDVIADTPPSLAAQDMKLDEERRLATEEGRKRAGL